MSFPPPFQTARLSFVPINADQHAESVFAIRGRADVAKFSIKRAPDTSIQETHAWLSNFNHFNQPTNTTSSPGDTDTDSNLEPISPIGYVVCEVSSSTSTSTSTSSSTAPTTEPREEQQIKIIGTSALRLGVSPISSNPSPNPKPKRWELGYGFHPDAWGRGIATEVVKGWIRQIQEGGLLDGVPGYNGEEVKKVLAACTDARNEASKRVLEKCGFVLVGEFVDEQGRANLEFEIELV